MKLNTKPKPDRFTHEGAPAKRINAEQQLRRSVLSCLLWERDFYEEGETIADRSTKTAEEVSPVVVAVLAKEARHDFHLRHAPLLLLCTLAKTGAGTRLVSETIADVISRADELTELVAMYWRGGKTPLSAQMKKGLAAAFKKFDRYQLAKYDRANAVRLRDVLFLTHPKPENGEQAAIWRQLVDGTLPAPDTWEVGLSGGADKKETWERMLTAEKLGYLAVLRNLRNMVEVGVDEGLIRNAILSRKGAHNVLPFRYVAAARACPRLEPDIDRALCEAIAGMEPLTDKTIILVDISVSMNSHLSARSDMTRMDAAAALASIITGDIRVFSFSAGNMGWRQARSTIAVAKEVPPRRGMAGIDAIVTSQNRGGTLIGQAVTEMNELPHDRLIVITDEQSHDRVPDPVAKKAYMINVASNQNGVGYGRWTHIDGFSERVLRFIEESERAD